MIEVRLPREGSTTMASGVVLEWFVDEGDTVTAGQVLAEIETDKVSFEVTAPQDGTIRQRCAQAGAEVEVGAVLLRIGDPSEPLPVPDVEVDAPGRTGPAAPVDAVPGRDASGRDGAGESAREAARHDPGSVRAAPAARRRARELGVDLAVVAGSGPLGRIGVVDVELAASGAAPVRAVMTGASGADDPLAGLTGHRAVIARRMAQSSQETAAVTLMLRADVTRIRRTGGVSLIDVVAHEAARCAACHPELNASLRSDGIVTHERVGLGYAVDGARGLIVPVVRDADVLTLVDFALERRRLVQAALGKGLVPTDLDGGTFTITNLGASGIEFFTPIITPGQCAILGLGATTPTVVATHAGSAFGVRDLLGLSLTFDHRVVDGAEGGRYLQDLADVLATWTPTP